eukprot:403331717
MENSQSFKDFLKLDPEYNHHNQDQNFDSYNDMFMPANGFDNFEVTSAHQLQEMHCELQDEFKMSTNHDQQKVQQNFQGQQQQYEQPIIFSPKNLEQQRETGAGLIGQKSLIGIHQNFQQDLFRPHQNEEEEGMLTLENRDFSEQLIDNSSASNNKYRLDLTQYSAQFQMQELESDMSDYKIFSAKQNQLDFFENQPRDISYHNEYDQEKPNMSKFDAESFNLQQYQNVKQEYDPNNELSHQKTSDQLEQQLMRSELSTKNDQSNYSIKHQKLQQSQKSSQKIKFEEIYENSIVNTNSSTNSQNESSEASEVESETSSSWHLGKRDLKQRMKEEELILRDHILFTQEDLELEIEHVVNQDEKVQEMQVELQELKKKNLNKKDLQIQRNRITAQLSRDRKKLENDYLRDELVKMKNKVRKIKQQIKSGQSYCEPCSQNLINEFNLPLKAKSTTNTNTTSPRNETSSVRSTDDIISENLSRGGFVGLNKRAALSVGFLALVAVICMAGLNGPAPLDQTMILQEQKSYEDSHLEYLNEDKLLLSYSDYEDSNSLASQLVTLNNIKDLRRNYINRQAARLQNQSKYLRNQITRSKVVSNYSDQFIIQPIKLQQLTLPYYYNQDETYENHFLEDNEFYSYEDSEAILDKNIHDFAEHKWPSEFKETKFLNNEIQVYSGTDLAYKYVESQTTSVYCPASQVILPEQTNSTGKPPILKMSNNGSHIPIHKSALVNGDKLHLVLTSDQIDIINPQGNSILEAQYGDLDSKPMYIELSCKIQEINYIFDKYSIQQ